MIKIKNNLFIFDRWERKPAVSMYTCISFEKLKIK